MEQEFDTICDSCCTGLDYCCLDQCDVCKVELCFDCMIDHREESPCGAF